MTRAGGLHYQQRWAVAILTRVLVDLTLVGFTKDEVTTTVVVKWALGRSHAKELGRLKGVIDSLGELGVEELLALLRDLWGLADSHDGEEYRRGDDDVPRDSDILSPNPEHASEHEHVLAQSSNSGCSEQDLALRGHPLNVIGYRLLGGIRSASHTTPHPAIDCQAPPR